MRKDLLSAFEQVYDKSDLLEETQRVIGEQVQIVQEQQAQATRIIRVALTVGGLLLTGISIFLSSPLFPGEDMRGLLNFSPSIWFVTSLIGTYFLMFSLILFGKVFASALVVLSPESGGIAMLRDNPVASILSVYRRHLLPPPLSRFLSVSSQNEGMSLRPGIDSEEIQNILQDSNSKEEAVERIISYNSGCIQGNEQLIEDNRKRLSEIYGIGVITILIISLAILLGFTLIVSIIA